MIREYRELLAELAQLNTPMAALALRVMAGSACVVEQQNYVQRLIAAGEWLWSQANGTTWTVIEVKRWPMERWRCRRIPSSSPIGNREHR
ncbi:MAG: hypothetical protein ACRDSH_00280 [Pseudonocardiaceae bacterium]